MTSRNDIQQNTCLFWDCDIPIRADHFFCYAHFLDFRDGVIDRCPECGKTKDIRYDVCLRCYRSGPNWQRKTEQSIAPAFNRWDDQKKAKTPTYHVGISFAGEDRDYARTLDAALKDAGLTVFFDENEQETLWGANLFTHLQDIYRSRCASVILLVSRHYARKHWPQHEFRSAQENALISQGYILPIMLENITLPGLPSTTGFIRRSDYSPIGIAQLVLKKFSMQIALNGKH